MFKCVRIKHFNFIIIYIEDKKSFLSQFIEFHSIKTAFILFSYKIYLKILYSFSLKSFVESFNIYKFTVFKAIDKHFNVMKSIL